MSVVAAAAVAGSIACGGASPRDPGSGAVDAVERWAAAVQEGDAEAIYELLDPATRATTSVEEIATLLSENRAELLDEAARIEARAKAGFPARARVSVSPTHEVVLVTDADANAGGRRWHVEGGVFGATSLATPTDAVRALHHALSLGSLEAILWVLSREARADAVAEIAAVLEETADPLALEVEVVEGRAVVKTPSGRRIVLVREANTWRIDAIGEAAPTAPDRAPEEEPED